MVVGFFVFVFKDTLVCSIGRQPTLEHGQGVCSLRRESEGARVYERERTRDF